MADNLPPDSKPVDQPISTPPSPDKKAILETPPQGTPIPQIATPPVATTPPAVPVNSVPDKKSMVETPPQGTPIPQIATPPAAETLSNKSSVGAVVTPPTPAPVQVEPLAFAEPASGATLADIENPYLLSGEVDRARLVAQSKLFRGYIEKNAKEFIGENIKSILDIGCGEGQLALVFARLYPDAQVIGIDKDEQAIAVAQRATRGMSNIKFEVGDILQNLPSGPFDLVYESMVLMHVGGTSKVLKSIYDVLKPGGRLWTKDVDPNNAVAVDHPAYARLSDWLGTALDKIGSPYRVAAELPSLLTAVGFTVLRSEREGYLMGNTNTQERITMSINLGAFYNARKLLSRVLQVSEIEIEKTHREIIDAMTAPGGPNGDFKYVNTISQRPLQPVVVTPPPIETPAFVVPESAAALPDVENPYILSGEVDRARLVAQTKLFRGYVEKNAKNFVGEDIKSILDLGCGEGQLTQVLANLYPNAHVVGVDRDEKAIDAARRAAKNISNITFEVGDILHNLPAGPFDLVYESIVLQHIPGTAQILNTIYNVLKPGGYLWTKDLHTNYITSIDHPAWKRLMDWLVAAADKIGAPWRIGSELPPLLTAAGFKILRLEKEVYPVGNMSSEGRISMSINFGAVYNARKMICKVLPVPESEIEQSYKEIIGVMLAPGGPQGEYLYMNTVSQRPVTAEAPTTTASSSTAVPDTKTNS